MVREPVCLRVMQEGHETWANAEALPHRCVWLAMVEFRGIYVVAHRESGVMLPGSAFLDYDRARSCLDFAVEHEFKLWSRAVERGRREGFWTMDAEDPDVPWYHFWDWVDFRYRDLP